MKNYLVLLFSLMALSCTTHAQQLTPKDFQIQLDTVPQAQILDVRTPKEFAGGHLENALNADWTGHEFESGIAPLDKNRPVYIYCLSGGRSADAAKRLRQLGFANVYELKGGLIAWRAANLPEENAPAEASATAAGKGLTMEQFKNMLSEDKLVLVDFHAEWCGPCKRMEPFLKEIASEMKDKVVVLRLDADENEDLASQMGIVGLPFLQLYKKKENVWQQMGFMSKSALKDAIRKQL